MLRLRSHNNLTSISKISNTNFKQIHWIHHLIKKQQILLVLQLIQKSLATTTGLTMPSIFGPSLLTLFPCNFSSLPSLETLTYVTMSNNCPPSSKLFKFCIVAPLSSTIEPQILILLKFYSLNKSSVFSNDLKSTGHLISGAFSLRTCPGDGRLLASCGAILASCPSSSLDLVKSTMDKNYETVVAMTEEEIIQGNPGLPLVKVDSSLSSSSATAAQYRSHQAPI
ncbi:hypothetical protein SLEP1_g12674 [Rubroshorea leprosula]|uniref:Uncharacterized protein n=1 Tax=Rubroshorea leprosula TaxID=152421 RepID=A0AAV5IMQ9_9ROSI|nr:hypothetical protein SLEP1_g12674 [Rubroshorea leprosula]